MDRRLKILERLPNLFRSIDGVVRVTRNAVSVEERSRPEIIINDGDEEADDQNIAQSVRRSPNVVRMTPEILIYTTGDNESASADLHRIRSEIIKRLYSDPEIKTLTGANGDIHYDGCQTQFAAGRRLEAEMIINVTISYPLIQSEM